MDLFDYGRHTPYILSAYGASLVVIASLIIFRLRGLKKIKSDANISAGAAKND